MKLSDDMLFAHPVMSPVSTDYRSGSLDADFSLEIDADDNLDLSVAFALKSTHLSALVMSGEAGAGVFLVCRPTYENRLLEMAPGFRKHRLRASNFFGTIQLRPVVWTKRAQKKWACDQLNEEYGGFADLPAAAVLAVGAEQVFSVDRERLRPFESVFSLASLAELPPGEIAVDTDVDKITIKVNPATKESIEGMRNSLTGRNLLLNSLYLPAVMQVLHDLRLDPQRHSDRPWFRVVEAKCSASGIRLENLEPLRDAQILLKLPFLKIEAEKERLLS